MTQLAATETGRRLGQLYVRDGRVISGPGGTAHGVLQAVKVTWFPVAGLGDPSGRDPVGEVRVTIRRPQGAGRGASGDDEGCQQAGDRFGQGRERRRELDKARDEQDSRVERATAAALPALDARKVAERSLREATEGLADGLHRLVSQDVCIERAAAQLDAKVVGRLMKLAAGGNSRAARSVASRPAPPDSVGPAPG